MHHKSKCWFRATTWFTEYPQSIRSFCLGNFQKKEKEKCQQINWGSKPPSCLRHNCDYKIDWPRPHYIFVISSMMHSYDGQAYLLQVWYSQTNAFGSDECLENHFWLNQKSWQRQRLLLILFNIFFWILLLNYYLEMSSNNINNIKRKEKERK